MRQYKKRIVALYLASALTVIGAFGEENYQNSLMSIRFDKLGNNNVSAVLYTKNQYTMPITTQKKDDNTYVIILKNTNSECKNTDLIAQGDILSIDVSTTPYTTNADGYTKIEIKTAPNTFLRASTALFLPDAKTNLQSNQPVTVDTSNKPIPALPPEPKIKQKSYWEDDSTDINVTQTASKTNTVKKTNGALNQTKPKTTTTPVNTNNENTITKDFKSPQKKYDYSSAEGVGNKERIIVFIGITLIAILVLFFFFMSKEKMASLLGEKSNYNFDDDDDKPKKDSKSESKTKKSKVIRNTIKKLDSEYTSQSYTTSSSNVLDENTSFLSSEVSHNDSAISDSEGDTVLDLDALFQEKVQQQSPVTDDSQIEVSQENEEIEDDLAAFLDEFTEEVQEEKEPEPLFDEEFYETLINNLSINFTDSDILKINQLIQVEITDEMLDLRDEYLNELKERKSAPTQQQIIENLIASYTVQQNITFTKEDVEALQKLMNVELDESFVKDLRTNPQRVTQVLEEIENQEEKPHKTSDILTLNVHDLLPDLSKELQKHGSGYIESNAKPDVVYFSEGYDVSKLSVDGGIFNFEDTYETQNEFKPSYEPPVVDSGYEFSILNIGDSLPDIKDVMANPEKYEEKPKEKVVVSENDLLERISNVTFKPFYDNQEENHNNEEPAPTVSDIKAEMNDFEGFEIIDTDNYEEAEEAGERIETEEQSQIPNVLIPTDKFKADQKENENNEVKQQIEEVVSISKNTEVSRNDTESEIENQKLPSKTPESIPKKTESIPDSIELVKLERQRPMLDSELNIRKQNSQAEELLKLIEEKQQNKKNEKFENKNEQEDDFIAELKKNNKTNSKVQTQTTKSEKANLTEQILQNENLPKIPEHPQVCVYEGKSYKVTNISECNPYSGCYLAQGDKEYAVFGFIGDKITKIKSYSELKSENIKMRLNETLPNGIKQYLVKVSTHKFVLNIVGNSMEWVMDLC